MAGAIVRETFAVGPLQCNCSVIGSPATGKAIIVDPGAEPDKVLAVLARRGWTATAILVTHAHFDHVGALVPLREATKAPIYMHADDRPLYEHLDIQTAVFGMPSIAQADIDHWAKDGEAAGQGDVAAEILHTPGHTPGSLCFHIPDGLPLLLTGDTLFAGGIGRTDLWGGDYGTIMQSIRQRLLSFPDEAVVVPGHGPETTIGHERHRNPFLQE